MGVCHVMLLNWMNFYDGGVGFCMLNKIPKKTIYNVSLKLSLLYHVLICTIYNSMRSVLYIKRAFIG